MCCAQSAPLFFTISPLICGPRTVPPAIGRTIRDTAVPWTFGIRDAPGSISATIRYINSRCGRRIGGSPDEKSLPGEGVLLGAMLMFGLLMKMLGVCWVRHLYLFPHVVSPHLSRLGEGWSAVAAVGMGGHPKYLGSSLFRPQHGCGCAVRTILASVHDNPYPSRLSCQNSMHMTSGRTTMLKVALNTPS